VEVGDERAQATVDAGGAEESAFVPLCFLAGASSNLNIEIVADEQKDRSPGPALLVGDIFLIQLELQ
jgi:hypothetical protein